jgi:hypothetical protein
MKIISNFEYTYISFDHLLPRLHYITLAIGEECGTSVGLSAD